MTIALLDALEARSGIVCLAGAGGKKSTMLRLAQAHPGRVALTVTTKISLDFAGGDPPLLCFGADATAADVVARAAGAHRFAYAGEPSGSGRARGVEPALVCAVHAAGGFDLTCVKADGARMLLAKAQEAGEPRLVEGAAVLLLASVRVVGRPLDDGSVHRPALFAAQSGLGLGDPVTAEALGAVLAHQLASLAAAGVARAVAVLNMADDEALLATARAVAAAIAARAAPRCRIVLASMAADDPLRAVLD